jgi:hypothetical protein
MTEEDEKRKNQESGGDLDGLFQHLSQFFSALTLGLPFGSKEPFSFDAL